MLPDARAALAHLESKYAASGRAGKTTPYQCMRETAQRYRLNRQAQVLDLASTATALSYALWAHQPDPLVVDAFQRANPSLSIDALRHLDGEALEGIANNTKGTYFELLIADRLNAGEAVGGVQLPAGFRAVLAERLNQPGWDLAFVSPSGAPVEYLQLKATDSFGYVREALERYPDIKVLTTSDVPAQDGLVISAEISDADLERNVENFLDESLDGVFDNFLDAFVPLAPLLLVAATEGYQVFVGHTSLAAAAAHARVRAARTLVASGAGAAAYALGAGWLSIPVAVGAGTLFRRSLNQVEMFEAGEAHVRRVRALARYQQLKLS